MRACTEGGRNPFTGGMNGDVGGIDTDILGGAGSIGKKLLRLARLPLVEAVARGRYVGSMPVIGIVACAGDAARDCTGLSPNSDTSPKADRVGSTEAVKAFCKGGRAGRAGREGPGSEL